MFLFDFNWQIQHFLNQFWWPLNSLLLVIAVITAYLAYKKPIYAAAITVVFLPGYLFRSYISWLPFTFLEVLIWLTFLGWMIGKWRFAISDLLASLRGRSWRLTRYRWPILLILLGATIGLVFSPDLQAAAGLWKAYFIEPILFFIVLKNVVKTENDKKILLWALGISTLAVSLLAICQKFSGFSIAEPAWTGPENRRVTSIFTSPNAVGLFLGPIVAIYFGWLLAEIKNLKSTILKLLLIIPALLAILFTISQGTWLGLAAAIVFLAYFGWNKKWTTAIIVSLIILVLIIPMTREIIIPIITFQDTSGQNRITLAQLSWQQLTSSPQNFLLGAGSLGFDQYQDQARNPLKIEDLLYPHNIILNFWSETGLSGLIGLIWLIVIFFKQGFRRYKLLMLGIMAAMITIIVHGLIDVPYFKNDLAVLFWLIVALI